MRRRRLLRGLATLGTVGSAGCVGGSDTEGIDPRTATPPEAPAATPTEPTAGLAAATLVPRTACPDPGSATVRLGDPVTVVGCVVGKNGCTRPRLASVDRDGGAVTVVVAAVERRDGDEACTDALVNLGYEVQLDFGDPPVSVTVVHDDVDGRRVVTDVTR